MSEFTDFLGLVQNGKFYRISPEGREVRLTSIAMQEARTPKSAELDLTKYEGCAIMVRGHDGGGWICSAGVIDQAGPILTAVVQKVFSQAGEELASE